MEICMHPINGTPKIYSSLESGSVRSGLVGISVFLKNNKVLLLWKTLDFPDFEKIITKLSVLLNFP